MLGSLPFRDQHGQSCLERQVRTREPQLSQCLQSLTDVHVGLVTRELLRVAAGEVENTRGVLPPEGKLKGARPRAGSEAARRRPQQRRNGPEGRHCGWRRNEGLK